MTMDTDGPFLLIVEHEHTGSLYFGPFRTIATIERMVARIERLAPTADWSMESLQPGNFAPEWARIITENEEEVNV
jgi:hypothetical protein